MEKKQQGAKSGRGLVSLFPYFVEGMNAVDFFRTPRGAPEQIAVARQVHYTERGFCTTEYQHYAAAVSVLPQKQSYAFRARHEQPQVYTAKFLCNITPRPVPSPSCHVLLHPPFLTRSRHRSTKINRFYQAAGGEPALPPHAPCPTPFLPFLQSPSYDI